MVLDGGTWHNTKWVQIMLERYSLSPMRELWSSETQYEHWLQVELAVLAALEKLGKIPVGTFASVEQAVHIDVARIGHVENEIRHDLLAFIRSLEEQAGMAGRFIHRGLTSSDVKDTALSLQIRDALTLVLKATKRLEDVLLEKAQQYQDLVIVGRTHGMHAEPTTLGLKFFLWYAEIMRDIARLERAKVVISVGKLSGPVGTYSQISPDVEELACEQLGLQPAKVGSQVLQRDRHAEVAAAIAITGTTLEKIALEIRHLSRSEVAEIEEPAPEGSSSMPHKRNPITSERICGLARILKGNMQSTLENVALWHERDMSHSSVERIVIPDSFSLIHYMLVKMTNVIAGLVVHRMNIERNIALSKGAIYSQILLIELVERGLSRSVAHKAIKTASQTASRDNRSLLSALREDPKLAELLGKRVLDEEALLDKLRVTSRRIIAQESVKKKGERPLLN